MRDTEFVDRDKGNILRGLFYDRVNEILAKEKFDDFAEKECVRFYKSETMGRPSNAPGVYAWRCADSLSLKSFLGSALTETTPDHSTVSGAGD